jgi:hypothetical protein
MGMKMKRGWTAAAMLLAGCATGGSSGSSGAATRLPVARARLGEDFRLAVKQIAVIDGEPLTVRFASVVSDSRCPAGVQCVRAGEARLEITIQQAGLNPAVDTLATAPPQPQRAAYGVYDVAVVGLEPPKRQDVPLPAYVATLRVTKR